MRTAVLFLVLVSMPWLSFAQAKEDSLSQFKYLYKEQKFPFDSGVAISDAQYSFLLRQSIYTKLDHRIDNALKPVPKIVYETKEVRKKGDGNKVVWFLSGTAAGVIVSQVIAILVKK